MAVEFDDPSDALYANEIMGSIANGPHTLSLWFYSDSEDASGLLAKYKNNVRSALTLSNGRVSYTHGGNNAMEVGFGSDIVSGSWNHLVMTVSGNNGILKLFLNGNYLGSYDSGINESSNNGISVGATAEVAVNDPYRNSFEGKIDNLRYYGCQLSDYEAIQLFNLESPKYTIISGNHTWIEAKSEAELLGGQLAVLDNLGAINEVNAFLQSKSNWPELWIGLEKVSNDEWLW